MLLDNFADDELYVFTVEELGCALVGKAFSLLCVSNA